MDASLRSAIGIYTVISRKGFELSIDIKNFPARRMSPYSVTVKCVLDREKAPFWKTKTRIDGHIDLPGAVAGGAGNRRDFCNQHRFVKNQGAFPAVINSINTPIQMANNNGVMCLRRIKRKYPNNPIWATAAAMVRAGILRAVRNGIPFFG